MCCVCVIVCLIFRATFSSTLRVLSLSAVSTDFAEIDTNTNYTTIQLNMSHLKVNDTLKMKFRSTVDVNFIQRYEFLKEFIRNTATVTIVKGTCMSVLFVEVFQYLHKDMQ